VEHPAGELGEESRLGQDPGVGEERDQLARGEELQELPCDGVAQVRPLVQDPQDLGVVAAGGFGVVDRARAHRVDQPDGERQGVAAVTGKALQGGEGSGARLAHGRAFYGLERAVGACIIAAMKIIPNAVVAVAIDLLDASGERVQRNPQYVYLHGHGGLFPKLEAVLEGKDVGEKVRLRLAAADAFGERDPTMVRTEERSRFPGKLKVGMEFEGEMKHDDHAHPMVFRVTRLDEKQVTLDANHPLAGQEIEVRCTVLEVRPASPEEVAHGHAHGPGGHHHH
jgi:FKBP-type peptidyl-prolyl cis-trans isomerase SlyD